MEDDPKKIFRSLPKTMGGEEVIHQSISKKLQAAPQNLPTHSELLRQVSEICGSHKYSSAKVLEALRATSGDVDAVIDAIFDQRLDTIIQYYTGNDTIPPVNIEDDEDLIDDVIPHVSTVHSVKESNEAVVILSSDTDSSPVQKTHTATSKAQLLAPDISHERKKIMYSDDDDSDYLPDWTEAMSQPLPRKASVSKNEEMLGTYFGRLPSNTDSSPPKPRKRRPTEEHEEEKQQKAAEKERKRLDREALKQQAKFEKEKERAIREANKVAVKSQTVTEMVLEMDEGILELVEGQAVIQQVKEMGAHVLLRRNKIPLSVIWKRHISKKWDHELSAYVPLPEDQQFLFAENIVVVIVRAKNVAEDISNGQLSEKVRSMKLRSKGKIILLVVIDMQEYCRNVRQQIQKSFKNASSIAVQLDKDAIERALLELNFSERVHHLILGRGENLYEWFMTFSREIAVAPYDQSRQAAKLTFGVEDLGPSGKTQLDTWQKMLQMLHGITPPIASVIVSHFPSIFHMCNVLSDPSVSDDDFVNHLANVSINRASSNTVRRLGPAIASRVMDMFLLDDPDANFR